MSDLLTFLNSADIDTLMQTPGITRALAEALIEARPFADADDCLKVHGMSRNLLERLAEGREGPDKPSEERAIQPVEEEAAPAPVVVSQTEAKSVPPAKGPSFASRLGAVLLSLFRGLVRLIALVIIVGALAALAIYGLPILRDYLLAPVAQSNAEIANLRMDLTAMQTQLTETSGRVDALEKSIEAHSASLSKLEGMQASLETIIAEGDANLAAELKRDLLLSRSIQYLARARLYLSESNFGLAKGDVQSARDLLAELQTSEPDFKPEAVKLVLTRLDLALGNLPSFPVIAVSDVDVALQFLMSDLPESFAFPTATPTPAETATPEPTFTPTPEATATP